MTKLDLISLQSYSRVTSYAIPKWVVLTDGSLMFAKRYYYKIII